MSIIIEFNDQQYLINSFADGAFKKLKTEGDSGGGMSVHNPSHNPSSSCPTPARRRHRTTFTQVSFQTITRAEMFYLNSTLNFGIHLYISIYTFFKASSLIFFDSFKSKSR